MGSAEVYPCEEYQVQPGRQKNVKYGLTKVLYPQNKKEGGEWQKGEFWFLFYLFLQEIVSKNVEITLHISTS